MEKQEQLTEEKRFCKCGCGRLIEIKPYHKEYGIPDYIRGHCSKGRFKKGQTPWMKGKHPSEESKLKNKLAHLGKPRLEETKYKIKIHNARYWKNHKKSKEHIEKMRETKTKQYKSGEKVMWNKGKINVYSQETLDKMSNSKLDYYRNNPDSLKKIGIRQKKLWLNPIFREKILCEEARKNRLLGLLKRPTSYEQKICNLCFKFNLPFVYVGNGNFFIRFKNPDFVDKKDKIIIEVFCSYFKKLTKYGSAENYRKIRKKEFESAGWKVIFLDENDVMADNWEERCLNKINEVLLKC